MMPTCPQQCEAIAWGSHMPALLYAIGSTVGNVLEIGIGHFSTPHLHFLCEAEARRLVSVEQDKAWHDAFASRYSSPGHGFVHGEYMDVLLALAKRDWAVVFIDHSPGGKARSDVFSLFIDRSVFVVVHDYHRENEDAIGPLLVEPISHQVVSIYEPPTLIASNKRTIANVWNNRSSSTT